MKMTLHHLNLTTANVPKMNDFYRNVMGLAAEPALTAARITNQGYSGETAFATDGHVQVHMSERDLALGLLGHVLTQTVFLTYMTSHGLTLPAYLEMVGQFSISRRLAALVIAIQAPILEESIYRGYLQRGIEARTGAWGAILLTALVFSVSNLRFDPAHLLMNFSYGLVWGLLRMRTRRLVAPAFAHSLNWVVNAGL